MTLHQTGLTINLCYLFHAIYFNTVIIYGVTCRDPGVVTSYTTFVICLLVYGVTCSDPGVVISFTTFVIYVLEFQMASKQASCSFWVISRRYFSVL